MRSLAIIPARLNSTRLPEKPLVNINGKSMIQRVFEQVQALKNGASISFNSTNLLGIAIYKAHYAYVFYLLCR